MQISKILSKYNVQSKSLPSENISNLKPSQAQELTQIITKRKESHLNPLNRFFHPSQHLTDQRISNNTGPTNLLPKSNISNPTRSSEMQKLQELKNRFKKIKNSYQENHKQINSNITHCIENYRERSSKSNNSHVNEFEILNEELTFSQSRQFNPDDTLNFQIHNRQISFRQSNPINNIIVGTNENKENHILSANQSLNNSHEIKYKSLTKELQNMRHNELVDLFIDQIEDNEKNKHLIAQQTQTINMLKKESQQRHSVIPKLSEQIESKREQIKILLETERKNLEIIEKLKKQLQNASKNQEKSLCLEHSEIHKSMNLNKGICNNINSQESSKIFAEKEDSESVDYKLKHDQLQKYMNEYINNVNQAHEEYKRNLQQLKDSNHMLKQQNINLTQDLNQSHNFKKKLQNELMQVSKDFEKLSHALNNSKEVIRELEEEFLIVKEENSEMKTILQRQGSELIEIKNAKQMMILEMDTLMMDNEHLHHRNEVLNEELTQIQERILTNTEIETQVRAMISGLSQQKSNIQDQVQKFTEENQKLKKQHKCNGQTIQALKQSQKVNQQKIKSLQTTIKCLEDTVQQLRTREQLLQKQNNILEETNQEMQKLQEELLFQYESEKDQKTKLKSELVAIMNQVKQMETIYINELSSNQLIKKELSKYWESHFNSVHQKITTLNNKENQHQRPKLKNSQVAITTITNSDLISQNSVEKMSSSDISFKKNSQLTKEGSGSSSVFRHNLNSEEIGTFSKTSEHDQNCINASSIVDGSRISEKYFSETDQDVHQELQILRSSKKTNMNINAEGFQGKIRSNWNNGCIKTKQNNR